MTHDTRRNGGRSSSRRLKSLALGAVLATLATWPRLVSAQPFDQPPPPAAPRPLAIAAPSEQTLANGLRIVVAERSGVPLVTALLVVLRGSEADPPRLAGLASMTAGLLTQGTKRHSAPELAALAESLGGSLDSSAGWNQSLVTITVTRPKIGAALGLVAEVAREPAFAPAELDRLRAQSLDGLRLSYARPGTIAGLTAARLAWGAGAYGHPANGTPASLQRIDRADLVALHRATWRPDRAVLILSGDIDAASARALAQTHFGRWAAPRDTAAAASEAGVAESVATTSTSAGAGAGAGAAGRLEASRPSAAIVDMAGAGQAAVAVATPLPARRGGDWAGGDVLNAILGGGYSSRLNQEIRIKRGLSYGVRSGIESHPESALLGVSVQTKNESAAEVVGLLQSELDRLMTAAPGADELAARKATLIGDFSRSVETTEGLAAAIRALIVTGRSPAELTTRIAQVQAVSADDVQRYAASHLGRAGRRVVVAGDAARFADAVRAAAPSLVQVRQVDLDLDRPGGLTRE